MAADPNAALVEALEHFLQEAKEAVDEEANRDGPLPLTPLMLAERLAELPACHEANAAVHHAGTANNYLVTSFPRRRRSREATASAGAAADADNTDAQTDDEAAEPSGRPLDAAALLSTGVFGMLQSRAPHDFHAVAEDLAGYLAGPPVGVWDYAILDGNFTTGRPHPGHRRLGTGHADQRRLAPTAAASSHRRLPEDRPFKPQDYGSLTMLRRTLPELPHHGPCCASTCSTRWPWTAARTRCGVPCCS